MSDSENLSDPQPVSSFDSLAHDAASRYRLRQAWAMTPEQRIERSIEMHQAAFEILNSNPAAHAAFVARNHHRRRQENVRRLEAEMRRLRPVSPNDTPNHE